MSDPDGPVLVLTDEEEAEGEACGNERYEDAQEYLKDKDRFGEGQDSLESHVRGARGEQAARHWFRDQGIEPLYECASMGGFGKGDVQYAQVRTCRWDRDYGTKVKDEPKIVRGKSNGGDPAGIPIISVVEEPDGHLVRGWLFAREGRANDEWIKDPGGKGVPNWFAPDSVLRPMSTLLLNTPARIKMQLPPLEVAPIDTPKPVMRPSDAFVAGRRLSTRHHAPELCRYVDAPDSPGWATSHLGAMAMGRGVDPRAMTDRVWLWPKEWAGLEAPMPCDCWVPGSFPLDIVITHLDAAHHPESKLLDPDQPAWPDRAVYDFLTGIGQ